MKTTKWLALATAIALPLVSGYAQAPAAGATSVSPNAAEVVKLAGSGVGDEVVLAYVQNAQGPFELTADNVLYLRDVGVSQAVITAMLNHDTAMRSQAPQEAPPPYAPTEAPAAPVPVSAPAPGPGPAPDQPQEVPPQQPAPPPANYVADAPPDVSYFYNDLAPYGSWVTLPGVGWCWQPSVVVVNRGWRPYCDSGHWVYTDAGWFWQSDYTWGWAPFHYGRWYMDARCGWVWTPGRVWGPAWVTWRTAGMTCGWAPLPPGADFVAGFGWRWHGAAVAASFDFGLGVNAFAFVSFGNFCAHDVHVHCLPYTQVTAVWRQTVVVNNYTVVRNTVVNNGIAVNRIAAVSHVPVPRATLREGPPGVHGVSGGAVVYRATLKAPEHPVHMVAQKVDVSHPYIQHTSVTAVHYDQKASYSGHGTSSVFQHTTGPAVRSEQRPYGNGTPTTTWQHNAAGATGTPGSAAAGTSKYQTSGHPASEWQGWQKPAANTQNYAAPKTYPGQTFNQESQASKGAGQTYGAAGQAQANYSQAAREAQTPHFYSPKTVEQSAQVRSIYQQPKPAANVPATGAKKYQ